MTDNDIIRKAVELADGWRIQIHSDVDEHAERFDTEIMWSSGTGSHRISDPGQAPLDALAAQLVRQVDATGKYYVETDLDLAAVTDANTHISEEHWIVAGPDRTMNTIKAIIDSKVLEEDTL